MDHDSRRQGTGRIRQIKSSHAGKWSKLATPQTQDHATWHQQSGELCSHMGNKVALHNSSAGDLWNSRHTMHNMDIATAYWCCTGRWLPRSFYVAGFPACSVGLKLLTKGKKWLNFFPHSRAGVLAGDLISVVFRYWHGEARFIILTLKRDLS